MVTGPYTLMMVLNDLGAMAARASGDLNTTNEMLVWARAWRDTD